MKKRFLVAAVTGAVLAAVLGTTGAFADVLDDVKSSGVLRVGVEGTYPPFTYHDDNNELTGYDVDVAKALAEKLGVEVEFTESGWDSLLTAVDTGRLDTVINDVSITEEREEAFDFTDPYGYLPKELIVRKDNDSIHSLDDLNGKKTAVNATNAYIDQLEALGAEIVPISTADEAFTLVTSGRADFMLTGVTVVNAYLEEHPDADIKVVMPVPGWDEVIGIPVKKGETAFRDALNDALQELRDDGTLSQLSIQYFGADYTNPTEDGAEAATEGATE